MVWKAESRNFSCKVRACSFCSRNRRQTISERRARVDSSFCASAVSCVKVCSWLIDFGPSSSPMSASNHPPASSPRDFPASATPSAPKFCSSQRSSRATRSPTFAMPYHADAFPSPCRLRGSCAHRAVRETPPPCPARSTARRSASPGRSNLRDQARRTDTDGAIQLRFALSSLHATRARRARVAHAGARCRSYRRMLRRWTPSPAWARSGSVPSNTLPE